MGKKKYIDALSLLLRQDTIGEYGKNINIIPQLIDHTVILYF